MTKKRKTAGQEAVDRLKNVDTKQTIVDTQMEMDKKYLTECERCIKGKPQCSWTDPWYMVIHLTKEKGLQNIIRRRFFGRQSLPYPTYDNQVWRYSPSSGDLEFLWAIPDKDTCMWMASSPQDIPEEQYQLLSFVMDMLDKKLYKKFYEKFELKK